VWLLKVLKFIEKSSKCHCINCLIKLGTQELFGAVSGYARRWAAPRLRVI